MSADVSEEHIVSFFRVEEIVSARSQRANRWYLLARWFLFLRNVGWHSTDCTALYPRRWYSWLLKLVYVQRQIERIFYLNLSLTPFCCITFSVLKCNKLFVKEKLYYFCRTCHYNIYLYVCTAKLLLYFRTFARSLKGRSHLLQATLFLQGGVHSAEGTRALSTPCLAAS
jgi:hypothetical protein